MRSTSLTDTRLSFSLFNEVARHAASCVTNGKRGEPKCGEVATVSRLAGCGEYLLDSHPAARTEIVR